MASFRYLPEEVVSQGRPEEVLMALSEEEAGTLPAMAPEAMEAQGSAREAAVAAAGTQAPKEPSA